MTNDECGGSPLDQIDIVIKDERWLAVDGLHAAVESVAAATLRVSGEQGSFGFEVSVALVCDDEIAELNRAYRNIDRPTNVLSFAQTPLPMEPDTGRRVLGDVVLARETIAKEARAQGKPVRDHAAHMVAHGILHLLEFDHQTADEEKQMQNLERQILAALGIPDPYCETLQANTNEISAKGLS